MSGLARVRMSDTVCSGSLTPKIFFSSSLKFAAVRLALAQPFAFYLIWATSGRTSVSYASVETGGSPLLTKQNASKVILS